MNIGLRRGGGRPTHLILHYTGFADAARAIDWLANPESGVSCHYVVDVDGTVTQMVAEVHRAWHAGDSFWLGETDLNSWSVGIEIQNPGHDRGYPAFPLVQMEAVAALSRDILARNGIAADRVLAHSDIAPRRKIDPGEAFDWKWLADQGVGVWVPPSENLERPEIDGLRFGKLPRQVPPDHPVFAQSGDVFDAVRAGLARLGYDCPTEGPCCEATVAAIAAFQRRWRPARVDGVADAGTLDVVATIRQSG
jgi:N-acetylmuramoyl-L-alanine amidase